MEHGYLPAGVHHCTLDEARDRFGYGDVRSILWDQFLIFIDDIKRAEYFSAVIIDGRFVSSDPEVRDIDVGLQLRAPDGSQGWLEALAMYSDPQVRDEFYQFYSVCIYLDIPIRKNLREWFQNIKPEHITEHVTPENARKGLLFIEL